MEQKPTQNHIAGIISTTLGGASFAFLFQTPTENLIAFVFLLSAIGVGVGIFSAVNDRSLWSIPGIILSAIALLFSSLSMQALS